MADCGKPDIGKRLKDLLDETRLVMLGTQLLLGLQYRAAFSSGFEALPPAFRWSDAGALLLILAASAFLLATPSFHQLAERGHATSRIINVASRNLRLALMPLAVALGIDVAIGMRSTVGPAAAIIAGLAFAMASIALWYGLPLVAAHRPGVRPYPEEQDMEDKPQSLETRIEQALTEIRVILPGVQGLFGFQFSAVLTQAFDRLAPADRYVHLASLAAVAVAIILLMAPVSYHRIAAGGAAREGVLRYASTMMLVALGLLAIGLVGDSYVTVQAISRMTPLAIAAALIAAIGFAALIYGVPLQTRRTGSDTARAA